jgi:hypothetical protein
MRGGNRSDNESQRARTKKSRRRCRGNDNRKPGVVRQKTTGFPDGGGERDAATNNDGFMNPLLPPELQLKTLSLTET